jgi:integrase
MGRLRPATELWALGLELMQAAEDGTADRTLLRRAERHRDGLLIALLAARPLRLANVAGLRVGRHLVRDDTGDGYRLLIAGAETKAGRPLEQPLPAALAPFLTRYLEHWRPLLLSCGGRYTPTVAAETALWISREGAAMPPVSLRGAVKRRTETAFGAGHGLTPHLFRDAAATAVAELDPEHMLSAASVLGNRPETMMAHYNQSQGRAAHRRYHAALAALRGGGGRR